MGAPDRKNGGKVRDISSWSYRWMAERRKERALVLGKTRGGTGGTRRAKVEGKNRERRRIGTWRKRGKANECLTKFRLTMSCYYIVQVRCTRGAGFKLRKKRHWSCMMRRGIDNYFAVSADIVEFVNRAENTSQERRI